MKFKEILIESKDSKATPIVPKKGPFKSIEIIKYKSGDFGILNWSMNPDLEWMKQNGFKQGRSTNYPEKTYKNEKELLKDLKNLFGISEDDVTKKIWD